MRLSRCRRFALVGANLTFSCAVVLTAGRIASGAITFSVAFDDPQSQLDSVKSLIEQHVVAAGHRWAGFLEGAGSIEVLVRTSTSIPFAEGRSFTSSFVSNNGAYDVFEQGMSAELRTGIDPNGADADVEILINPDYAINELWYDPEPALRTATVDVNRTDAMSTFLHEFGHALGYNGWINATTGTFPGNYQSTYDEHIEFDGTNFYFVGAEAVAVNGVPPALTFANVSHVGNFAPRRGDDLVLDLMNGLVFYRGSRYDISTLNLAMLKDARVPLNTRAGDFDLDGDVDGQDLLFWQRDSSVGTLAGWRLNFGTSGPIGSIQPAPEPRSLALLATLALWIAFRPPR